MKSATLGESTSNAEVTNVSPFGLWIPVGAEELYLPYEDFPWFKSATIAQVTHVERPSPGHLYWPELDIDLAVDSIRNPGAFPLVVRGHIKTRCTVRRSAASQAREVIAMVVDKVRAIVGRWAGVNASVSRLS